jgi:hypothetical protein
VFDWATGPILARFNKGNKPGAWWAAKIKQWDAQALAKPKHKRG